MKRAHAQSARTETKSNKMHYTYTHYTYNIHISTKNNGFFLYNIMRKLQEKLGHKQITKPNTCTGTHSHKQWKTTAPPHRTKNEIRMK